MALTRLTAWNSVGSALGRRPPLFVPWLSVALACLTIAFPTAAAGSSSVGAAHIKPGPLKAGTYTTATFRPALSFELEPGWISGAPESPNIFSVLRSNGVIVGFLRVLRVIEPKGAYPSNVPSAALEAAPADLVAWLQHHPRLRAGKRVPVTVGGVRGVRIDTVVTEGYRSKGCPGPCVLLFAVPGVEVFHAVGQTARNYVLKVAGSTLLIAVLAPSVGFSRLVRDGEQVVSSVRFRS